MKIMLDCDGVLTSFVDGACKLHNVDNPYKNPAFQGIWDFVQFLDMEPEKFWEPLGFDFWYNLDWMHDGREILSIVEAAVGKDNVCLLTSPCQTAGCVDGKREWVAKNMPDYKQRLLIGAAKEFCAGPKRILVDDHSGNVTKFKEAGGHTVLVPRVWNYLYGCNTLATVKSELDRLLTQHR